jgi:hypothetical protein
MVQIFARKTQNPRIQAAAVARRLPPPLTAIEGVHKL